jgi:hypothetical protein
VFKQLKIIEDKLNMVDQALTDLQTVVTRLSTDIQTAITKLTSALPASAVADADVEAQVAALAKAANALEAVVNPTPVPITTPA